MRCRVGRLRGCLVSAEAFPSPRTHASSLPLASIFHCIFCPLYISLSILLPCRCQSLIHRCLLQSSTNPMSRHQSPSPLCWREFRTRTGATKMRCVFFTVNTARRVYTHKTLRMASRMMKTAHSVSRRWISATSTSSLALAVTRWVLCCLRVSRGWPGRLTAV